MRRSTRGCTESPDDRKRLTPRWWSLSILLAWTTLSVVLLVTLIPVGTSKVGLFAGGWDFHVYREGSRYLLDGKALYDKPFKILNLYYTYTPFSTITFVPFDWMSDNAGRHIWFGINVFLLLLTVLLCWRMLGYRITPYTVGLSVLVTLVCCFLEPVRTTLFFGQINIFLMLLVLWDVSRPEGSRLKGIGIGIAAGIKLTPAFFALYYLATKQWRATVAAFVTIAATVGLGWAIVPNDSYQYWTGKFLDYTRIGKSLFHPANQSFRGAIARLTGEQPPTWLWLSVGALFVVVSMWIAARLYRQGETLLAVTVAGLTSSAVSPFTWSHHWVWVVPMLVYLVHRAFTSKWWWLAAAALYGVMGSWTYSFPKDTRPRVGLYLFAPKWVRWEALVNLHLLVYIALLFAAALITAHTSRQRRRGVAVAAAVPPIAEPVVVDVAEVVADDVDDVEDDVEDDARVPQPSGV